MSETQPERLISFADVAAEPPEESIQREAEAVGGVLDTGDLVPEDDAQ